MKIIIKSYSMKTKIFFFFGVLCLSIISYEHYASTSLWNAIMNGTTGRDKEYIALRTVFTEKYEAENIYQIANLKVVMGTSIFLGIMSALIFFSILITKVKHPITRNMDYLKVLILVVLMFIVCKITYMNLWMVM